MTYEKYMKYKTKYLKLKELEKQLIASGKIHSTQIGGNKNISKMCKNCYNMHSLKNKFCKLCNENNIFNISKLTNTPTRMNIHGEKYEIHNALLEKLQPIQEGGVVEVLKDDNQIDSNKICNNCYKIHNSKNNFGKLCNENNIFKISKLTNTPTRMELYDVNNNELLEKLQIPLKEKQELQNGGNEELYKSDDNLSTQSSSDSKIDNIFEKTKLKDLSLKNQLMNMPNTLSELTESESLALSIFDS
jgi:hypothetical protein